MRRKGTEVNMQKYTDSANEQGIDATIRVADVDATVRRDKRLVRDLYTRAVAITEEKSRRANALTVPTPVLDEEQSEQVKLQVTAPHKRIARAKSRRQKHGQAQSWLSISSVICLLMIALLLGYQAFSNTHDPSIQAASQQKKAYVDTLIAHARSLGVSEKELAPIIAQEQQINRSLPWLTPNFYLHPAPVYQAQAAQYSKLQQRIPNVISSATQQAQSQAQQALQSFQVVVSRINMQPIGDSNAFTQRFSIDELQLESAQSPKDYDAISTDATSSVTALNALGAMSTQLMTMQSMLSTMSQAHLNTTALQKQYQTDTTTFNNAATPQAIQQLQSQLTKHYQQIMNIALQDYPVISQAKLQKFSQQITTLKSYGKDVTGYLKLLQTDRTDVAKAHTQVSRKQMLQRIDSDIASMQGDLASGDAHHTVALFHQEVAAWAKAHPYHDSYDGKDYAPDSEYMSQGIGSIIDADLAGSSSTEDFNGVTTEAQNALFNLHLLEMDSQDNTAYNKSHATDKQALDHYNLNHKQVLMISLAGQSMRLYQNGQLQRSFQVVTGSPLRPSLPGVWSVLDRKSPTVFISKDPKGSPFWFAPTPISYAILYHYGGDYLHDASWRGTFGAGSQYPHQDTTGNTPYNYDGSHGCINMMESDMAWVYTHTNWQTEIVIY
jgi:L,D-transpeptidase catalytic domain